MYKIVFLLLFSAAAVIEAKKIWLQVTFESGSYYKPTCKVSPTDTQTVTEKEDIQINFQITNNFTLKNFWCKNAKGKTIYLPTVNKPSKYEFSNMHRYKLKADTTESKSDNDGTWNCTYQISKKSNKDTTEPSPHENTCFFQLKVIEQDISLNIAQLSEWTWINKRQRTKQYSYNYTFTEGEKTFDCILDNPTEYNQKYTIYFYILYSKSGIRTKFNETVTIEHNTQHKLNRTFKLDNDNSTIICQAVHKNGTNGVDLENRINLHYMPPLLSITGPKTLVRLNETTYLYYYNFSDEETVELNCTLNKAPGSEEIDDIAFYYSNESTPLNPIESSKATPLLSIIATQASNKLRLRNDTIYYYNVSGEETVKLMCTLHKAPGWEKIYRFGFYYYSESNRINTTFKTSEELKISPHISDSFKLNKDVKSIGCEALDHQNHNKYRIDVFLHYDTESTEVSGFEINIEGLPDGSSCTPTEEIYKMHKICNYEFSDQNLLGKPLILRCVLSGITTSSVSTYYTIKFGTEIKTEEFKKKQPGKASVSYEIPLTAKDNNVTCMANGVHNYTATIYIHYISSTAYTTTTSTTTTTTAEPLPNENANKAWLTWALGGGALVLTICVIVGYVMVSRQKKPSPAESTYANLAKDQNTYQTMPVVPAPRTIQKPNVTQKPNVAYKPKVALVNNYSEPKDSQDMSEALYADPNRFKDFDTYAEPYVKSNYATPDEGNSEGNYSELRPPNSSSKELYAQPIPKAQRKPKVKDDCNYSNVFDEYANAKK